MGYGFCYNCKNRMLAGSLGLSRPAAFGQLYLGTSNDGELMLVERQPKDSMQESPTNIKSHNYFLVEPSITKLPDEILNEIFRLSIAYDWSPDYYTHALALSMVCKLFHRIVQPLLFQTIEIRWPHNLVPACKPVVCLHRSIKADPTLGTLCKNLSFHVSNDSMRNGRPIPKDYTLGEELLSRFPNVTSFALVGGFSHPPAWPFVKKALKSMPCIKSLTLSGVTLPPVFDIIQTTQLQSLTLDDVSVHTDGIIRGPNSMELERISSIIKLDISNFKETPTALQSLLKLPKALQHFRFDKIHSNPVSWDLRLLQSLLHDQRASLKSIVIGALEREKRGISFLDFPELEILTLSRWVFDFSPEVASATLLAPKLHTFIWDFTIIDQHSESWSDFGPEQRDWILGFAERAIKRKSALRRIEIIFAPEHWSGPNTRELLKDRLSPWDLMDQVRDAIRPDIGLSYSPNWSREECLALLDAGEWEEREEQERMDN